LLNVVQASMTKIYTKTGDDGYTKNLLGKRKPKSDLEFEIVGTLDELNACLGLLHTSKNKKLLAQIRELQSDLLTIGALVSGFKSSNKDEFSKRVSKLESLIDAYDAKNKPLKNFILPGGSFESGILHYTRTICRRLERLLVRHVKDVSVLIYINRLSDLLFVLARFFNSKGKKDILWMNIKP
jgi:cob(I)alamin adenosyltransferase